MSTYEGEGINKLEVVQLIISHQHSKSPLILKSQEKEKQTPTWINKKTSL